MKTLAIAIGLALLIGSSAAQAGGLTTSREPIGHPDEDGLPPPWGDPCFYRETDGPCPAGAVLENEPKCYDGYVDLTNGGCNSIPPVYSDLPQDNVTICGEYGTFSGGTRDTDWYRFVASQDVILGATLCGSAENVLYIVGGIVGCTPVVIAQDNAGPGQQADVSSPVSSGETVVVFVATAAFEGTPCGSPYILRVSPIPAAPGREATGVDLAEYSARDGQPVPNPSTGSTRMSFTVGGTAPQDIDVAVFNVAGQKVRTLMRGIRSPGPYEAIWDGLDESGLGVPAGLYFFRVMAGTEQTVRRVSLVR